MKAEPPSLLDSIDSILEGPLLSLANPLLAEDEDVPDVDSATLCCGDYSIIKDDSLYKSARFPVQIDDKLVAHMKRPIDLPAEDSQPDDLTDDYSGLVDAISMIPMTSRHCPLSSPRQRHHERLPAPDVARYGSTHCSAALSLETSETPRRLRSFGHAH